MTISRAIYQLCVAAIWTTLGVCIAGVVLTNGNLDWVGALIVAGIITIYGQLFLSALRLKTLGGSLESLLWFLHVIGGPVFFFQLLFAPDPPRNRQHPEPGNKPTNAPTARPPKVSTRHATARPRPATQERTPNRPTAAEWIKVASGQRTKP